jgi:rod shape-determining protein MreD
MDNNLKLTLVAILLLFVALLLQSTILNVIAIIGVKPDITLMVIIFLGFRKGSIPGQIAGFFTGLFEDFISLTPPGFNSLVKTSVGFLYGRLQGGFMIDTIIIPVIFLISGTIIKGILSWLIKIIFSLGISGVGIFTVQFLIEILYNALVAPFIFALLKLIKIFKVEDKEKVS